MKSYLLLAIATLLAAVQLAYAQNNCNLPQPMLTNTGAVLSAAGTFSSFQWYKDGQTIDGATTATFTPSQGGEYKVLAFQRSENFNAQFTSRKDFSTSPVSVFPNPSKERCNLTFPGAFGSFHLDVVDVQGKILLSTNVNAGPAGLDVVLETHTFKKGMYFWKLNGENNTYSGRFQVD